MNICLFIVLNRVREEPQDLGALQAALLRHSDALVALPDIEAKFPNIDNQFATLQKNDVQIPLDVSQKRQQLLKRYGKLWAISTKKNLDLANLCYSS